MAEASTDYLRDLVDPTLDVGKFDLLWESLAGVKASTANETSKTGFWCDARFRSALLVLKSPNLRVDHQEDRNQNVVPGEKVAGRK